MKIKEVKTWKFNELTKDLKQTVIENYRDINTDYDWWDNVYCDAKEIGKLLGIDIDEIYFSGFSSQGDGACFEGSYSYNKNSVKLLKDYAPIDKELHRIAQTLQDIQKPCFYSISASVIQSGMYLHEFCTILNIDMLESIGQKQFTEAEKAITETLRDFMRWIYRQLNSQYDCVTTEEAIIETIEANEHDFDENGKIF